MPSYPSQDLTNQYISQSYGNLMQTFHPVGSDPLYYILNGYGDVLFTVPTSSQGNTIITSDQTITHSISSSYSTLAISALTSTISDTASLAISAEYSDTSSLSVDAISSSYSFSASYAGTASILLGYIQDAVYSISASFASSSNSASYLLPGATLYLSQSWIEADVSSSAPPYQGGIMYWDKTVNTFAIQSGVGDTTLKIGQQMWLYVIAGANMRNGDVVFISGSYIRLSDNVITPIVFLARADQFSLSSSIAGMATQDIPSGSYGMITTSGEVSDLDTSAFLSGDILYLSNTQSGSVTNVAPDSPSPIIEVGICLHSDSSNGVVLLNPSAISSFPNLSSGVVDLPSFTDNGNGTFTLGSGSANFYSNSSGSSVIKTYGILPASFTASLNIATYVYYDYNNGYPISSTSLSSSDINGYSKVGIYTLFNYSNRIYKIGLDSPGLALSNKLLRRFIFTERFVRDSGLMLGETGSRNVTITGGNIWYGVNQNVLANYNSTTGTMLQFYHSASVWTSSIVTQYNNNQYDTGTSLALMGGGKYNVNYIYRTVGDDTAMLVIGSYNDNLLNVQASQPPGNLPQFISTHGILVGRIIFIKDGATATQIDSAFSIPFTPSVTTNHNDLAGLQGGASNEYYHLTSIEYGSTSSGSFLRQTGSIMSGMNQSIILVSGSYIPTNSDYTILGSGSFTITLPLISGRNGKILNIKKIDNSGSLIIKASGSNLIDGVSQQQISTQYTTLTIQSYSGSWYSL